MLNLKMVNNEVLFDMPKVSQEKLNALLNAGRKFKHVLTPGETISGSVFAGLIADADHSKETNDLIEIISLIDILPPHYIFATSDSVCELSNDHKQALNKAKGELNEKATERLNSYDGMKGYPFSFKNSEGKLSLALAFGHSEEDAYEQVEALDEFTTPNQLDKSTSNRAIHGFMSLTERLRAISDSVYPLPAINYK